MTAARSIHVPTLRAEGLTLQPRALAHVDAVVAACQDPEIPRWTRVPSPYTREHGLEFVSTGLDDAASGEAAHFVALDEAGELTGSFSLLDLHAEPGQGEIGYWVAAAARGRGVATRAVRVLTDWGHDGLGLHTILILVHRDNEPSHGVPLRAGYERMPGLHPVPRNGEFEPVFVRYESRRG